MSDSPTQPPAPAVSPSNPPNLLAELDARYQALRARDRTIARFQREIEKEATIMRAAYQRRKIAALAMREQEKWLREEAAALIRKERGIQTIPGFVSRRESAIEFRKNLSLRHAAAEAAAKAALAGPPK